MLSIVLIMVRTISYYCGGIFRETTLTRGVHTYCPVCKGFGKQPWPVQQPRFLKNLQPTGFRFLQKNLGWCTEPRLCTSLSLLQNRTSTYSTPLVRVVPRKINVCCTNHFSCTPFRSTYLISYNFCVIYLNIEVWAFL